MRVVVKVVKGIREFVVETVGDLVLEALVCLLLLAVVGGVLVLAALGYSVSPAGTLTAAGLFVAFTGYGAVELFRGPGRRRPGRLTTAAVVTAGTAATLAFLAVECGCEWS
ncbi:MULTISPECIES: hypothetical protein [unclassified Streptomyces]|uniref:hypothetical protein n=1 Tax=unclassified Streptomyces TaxID=2593676 RepID=UPI0036F9D387